MALFDSRSPDADYWPSVKQRSEVEVFQKNVLELFKSGSSDDEESISRNKDRGKNQKTIIPKFKNPNVYVKALK